MILDEREAEFLRCLIRASELRAELAELEERIAKLEFPWLRRAS